MAIKLSSLEAKAVDAALTGDLTDPVDLMRKAGQDVTTFFQHGRFSALDFRKSDLRGVSFLGAELDGVRVTEEQADVILGSHPRVAKLKVTKRITSGARLDAFRNLIQKASDFSKAFSVLKDMDSNGVRPDLETYKKLISLAGDFAEARSVLEEMEADGVLPDLETYKRFISKAGDFAEARSVLAEMEASGVRPDLETYKRFISKAGDFAEARSVLEEMEANGTEPDFDTYRRTFRRAPKEAMPQIIWQEVTLAELKEMVEQVVSLIDALKAKKLKEALKAAKDAAEKFGFRLEDLASANVVLTRKSVAPKYQNPANPEITWSGRGRKPNWFKEALANGAEELDLLFNADETFQE